ncbi:hypothetical protein CI1B_29640 [Bradyrhizobium ivorense]|uniref:Uncharacterized protein n=1 Tax=Bradyrhizobium ivorense TaxID=2511166 RepID=A0A508T8E7_9BRAD|nr:hypothetical protein CI1B_29640 [Bradyrhizobium ivorense]
MTWWVLRSGTTDFGEDATYLGPGNQYGSTLSGNKFYQNIGAISGS